VRESVHFTNEVGLERARGVVPLESLAVSVPQFQTVLLLSVLVSEVVGLSGVPVGEGQGTSGGHPEEVTFFTLVGA
jgi:hypothetical protein